MTNWNYAREESTVNGKHRCVIVNATEKMSKKGNPMIEIELRPSKCRFTVKTWLVQGDSFNRNATAFFDAFPEIEEGDFNLIGWIGAEGAVNLGPDDRGYTKVKGFVDVLHAATLPPYEGDRPEKQEITSLDDDGPAVSEADDDLELPFV